MTILETVKLDLTTAMKAGEKDRVTTLRMLLSELQKAAKDGSSDELAVVRRERKRRLEAQRAFTDGGREDLAQAEDAEARLISVYLPAEIADDDLRAIVLDAVAKSGAQSPRDLGKVIPLVMAAVNGRADGRRVSEQVREALTPQ